MTAKAKRRWKMEQRSNEWHNRRRGMLTASRFCDIMAKPDTQRYQGYLEETINNIIGVPDFDDDDKPWFEHGIRLEPDARGRYEWEMGVDAVDVGFIVHPKYNFIGCSPDMFVGDNGGGEIKSHVSLSGFLETESRPIDKGIPPKHRPQVQGSLWISGRNWWDFISYYSNNGKTMIHIRRCVPDLPYIKKLESACLKFWDKVQERLMEMQ